MGLGVKQAQTSRVEVVVAIEDSVVDVEVTQRGGLAAALLFYRSDVERATGA